MTGLILATCFLKAKPTLELVKTFADQHRTRTCSYSVEVVGIPGKGIGTWQCQGSASAWKASFMGKEWAFCSDGAWNLSLDNTSKTYAMDQFISGIAMPSESVDEYMLLAYPICLAAGDLRYIESGLIQWAEAGSSKLGSEQLRKVKGTYTSSTRTREITVWVAPSGEIRQSTDRASGSTGTHQITMHYQPSTAQAPEKALITPHLPPPGFSPAPEKMPSPAMPGDKIRLPQGLKLGKKAALIYVPNPKGDLMRPFLAGLIRKISSVDAVLCEISGNSEKRWQTFRPDTTTLADLHPAGTPSLFLIENDGEVLDSWLGFDPARTVELERDILQAFEDRKEGPT